MTNLAKLSRRWASWVSSDSKALTMSLSNALLGLALIALHIIMDWDSPVVLAVGVFTLTLAWKQFERAGFVALLEEERRKKDDSPIEPVVRQK